MQGLSEAEAAFWISPEGRNAVARARRDFEMSEGYKGPQARLWCEGREAAAIRAAYLAAERERLEQAEYANRAGQRAGEEAVLRQRHGEALAAHRNGGL